MITFYTQFLGNLTSGGAWRPLVIDGPRIYRENMASISIVRPAYGRMRRMHIGPTKGNTVTLRRVLRPR